MPTLNLSHITSKFHPIIKSIIVDLKNISYEMCRYDYVSPVCAHIMMPTISIIHLA
jgi:hypothetical protein